jgi:hypothetical protein
METAQPQKICLKAELDDGEVDGEPEFESEDLEYQPDDVKLTYDEDSLGERPYVGLYEENGDKIMEIVITKDIVETALDDEYGRTGEYSRPIGSYNAIERGTIVKIDLK